MKEFKEFISKGNVMDMAVGVIVGGAFTGIVNALVEDIINPAITLITGGSGTEVGGLNFNGIDLGAFISAVINFLIVAFVLFCAMRGLNRLKNMALKEKKEEEEKSEELSKEAQLLKEINETLKKSVILPKINSNQQ